MEVFLRKPSIGVAHPFLVQLVPFEAPLTGPFSAPTDSRSTTLGNAAGWLALRRLGTCQRGNLPLILTAACGTALAAQVEVPARQGDNGLARGFVFTVFGWTR